MSVREGTFAYDAAQGIYLDLMCPRCRHVTAVTCRSLCERRLGAVAVVRSQSRFRCTKCGGKGVTCTMRGYWTGAGRRCPGQGSSATS